MSVIDVRTAVDAPEEHRIRPGDLISLEYAGGTSYGRVFQVEEIQGIAYVWWSTAGVNTVNDGLMWYNIGDLRFESRPPQYLAVLRTLPDGTRYAFVVTGADVSEDEYAFEQSGAYEIISRRIQRTITQDVTDDDNDDAHARMKGVVENGECITEL